MYLVNMENKIKQLRKGILELAIMKCLYADSHYGYSLVRTLSDEGGITLTEGTIYPILSRLHKEGMVGSQWVESSQGPPRKYYSLSSTGKKAYEVLGEEFQKLSKLILNGEKKPKAKQETDDKLQITVRREKDAEQ
jgi:PadR family transcriptional regulator PadR